MSEESDYGNDDALTQPELGPTNKSHHHQPFVASPPPTERVDDAPPSPPPLPQIPFDLISEILLRLPVRSLLRFKCVCKQWKSIISDTHFAKSHLFRSTMDSTLTHHRLLLPTETGQREVTSCSVKSLFNNPLTSTEDVNFMLRHRYRILGSCNGLACLVARNNDYVRLWNPTTRLMSRKSPYMDVDDDEIMMFHGFGYDHVSDRYKVVFVFPDPRCEDVDRNLTKVYAFGDDSWKTSQNLSFLGFSTNGSGKFVGSTLNWVAMGAGAGAEAGVFTPRHILSFELGKEVFGEVSLPDFGDDEPEGPIQGVLKDCLCVCYDYEETHLVVWLMKEYGVKESWMKLMAIPHVELQIFGFVPYIEPLCMSENGEVLVKTTFVRTVVYNPKVGRLEYPNVQSDKFWYDQYIYVESLVSPCF